MQPNLTQMANTAYGQGQNLQNEFNSQGQQLYGQYQGAASNAANAQQGLQSFGQNLPDQSQAYAANLANAQGQYGFDPQNLLKAQKALAVTQTTLANLPDAIRQQGNYYGTTAGAETNNYAQQAGLLQNVLAGQGNAVNAYQSMINATQAQAAQQSQLGLQGQQVKLQSLQAQAQNYVSIMQTTGSMMAQLEQLAQNQGGLNASQQAQYAQAYSAYTQANQTAAMTQQQIANLKAQTGYVNGLMNPPTANQGGALNLPAGLTSLGGSAPAANNRQGRVAAPAGLSLGF